MQRMCDGIASTYEFQIDLNIRNVFDVLVNDDYLSDAYLSAAEDILGSANVSNISLPATGSEDFADMLRVVPGAYCRVGHTGTTGLHNPAFILGQEVLSICASIMARVVEKRLHLS